MTTPMVPLVFIHGVGLDHTMWDPVVRALRHRRTVSYDMIGHGTAPKPAGPYALETFVRQLDTIVEALASEVDLVGFSMGALVAQGYALRPDASIRRLVLLNGVHDRSESERKGIVDRVVEARAGGYASTIEPALRRWFTPQFTEGSPDVVAAVRERLERNDVRAYADAYEVFATADVELAGRMGAVTQPTLVVTGSEDQRSTPAMACALADAMPDARALIVPGLRHLTPLEAPDLIAKTIDDFTTG
jgi:pimeloyl-ACP methyl ester carboxylesterase